MFLKQINLHHERFPTQEHYPFSLPILQQTLHIHLTQPVTFFVGENGSGKSTLLEAVVRKCGIHIWAGEERTRFETNIYEDKLHRALSVDWVNGHVPGSFFSSQIFNHFARFLDQIAHEDPNLFDYFGGKSLMTQSHGQSLLSFFSGRYQRKGIYLLDEPETALSPQSLLELLKILTQMTAVGVAQFVIATHSPILLACPGATIYNFDHYPIQTQTYEQTPHYRFYRDFMNDYQGYIDRLNKPA